MCIAILNTPNVTFPKSLISNCWDNNSDGAGLIYANAGTLYTFKELDSVDKFYNHYIDVRRRYPKSKIVLHFRIGTSGGINLDNCHPFSVDKNLAFVHNGIIAELNGIHPKKSDTNLFNERILQKLPVSFENNGAIMSLIEEYIGSSKLVFLNAKNEAVIVNEGLGKEDEKYPNCWFSNTTYKPSLYYDRGGVKVWKDGKSANTGSGKGWGAYYDQWDEDYEQYGNNWETESNFYESYAMLPIETARARFQELDEKPSYALNVTEKSEYFALQDLINEHRYNDLVTRPFNDLTDAEFQEMGHLENVLGYSA